MPCLVPFEDAVLCLDCRVIYAGLRESCPACAASNGNTLSLATVLDRPAEERKTQSIEGAEFHVYQS